MGTKQREAPVDVVVIGGGPAGSAVATLLAKQQHSCVLLESATFPRYHIGESLIPHTYATLDRLGLLPKLRASAFPVKHSVRFVSPSGTNTAPFYFSETISGERAHTWQVERSEFDRMCLDNAIDSGVDVRMPVRAQEVRFDGHRAVGVQAKNADGESHFIPAKTVVDASGRVSLIGSQRGLKIDVPGLNKASIWTYFRGGRRREGIDAGETTVFMIPQRGWFWYIPLADDIVSVGVVADVEYLFDETKKFDPVLQREIKRCAGLSECLQGATQVEPAHGLRRLAYYNRQVAGDGWLMVGDAAGFLDPIYSSGLFLALASGELAADCIHEALLANDTSVAQLGKFSGQLWDGVEVIRRLIHAFYDPTFSFHKFEQQFPEQRNALIDCLVGDVVGREMTSFLKCLASMSPPPAPLFAEEPQAVHT
jgi:flavin-dependent dehydrogenase